MSSQTYGERDEVAEVSIALLTAAEHDDSDSIKQIAADIEHGCWLEIVGVYFGIISNLQHQLADFTGVPVDAQLQDMAAWFAANPYDGP